MKFKSFVTTVMAILGITAWNQQDEKNILTAEQKEKLKTMGFNDVFVEGFEKALADDFKDEEGAAAGAAGTDARAAVLNGLLAQTSQSLATAQDEIAQMKAQKTADDALLAKKVQEIQSLQAKVNALSAMAEQDPGKGAQRPTGAEANNFNLDDDKQLGGMQGVMYGLDRPYNLRAKAALLAAQGISMNTPVASSLDYETLKADLGAFYRVPWQQRLQSFLMELPSLEKIFPLQSGYQDLATLVNIWLGEFSQADNTVSSFDNVTKGNYDFGTETLRMYDVMFAHKFTNLKALEKNWLGSLNREGSQVIKWSFIEYILAETAKKLHNEREQRRINGVRKDPDFNKPGRAMEAADGVYEFIRKKVDGHMEGDKTVYQIKPFKLGVITPENIGEVIYQGTSMIPAVLRDSGTLCLYLPSYMLVWYDKYNELHYGRNTDYQGAIRTVKEYPSVKIVTVPNADGHQRLIWTMDGNIQLFEDRPGEMLNFNLEQQDWTLKVWSNWKESVWAVAVGFKYTDKTKMGYDRQMIFTNEYDLPASTFIEAAADKNPDVKLHTSIITVANTTQLTITDIENAQVGVPVVIKCGSVEKGVTIAKSGKFSMLSAAWTPAVGETITLMKRADGKFIELGRGADLTGVLAFAADATTPSVAGATEFVTDANTAATAITDLQDAEKGVIYTIYGAGSTNASTIASAGNFSLTAAMTLSAGKWIQLVKAGDNKFYEVARG